MSALKSLDGAGRRDKNAEQLRALQADLEHIIAMTECMARVTRAKYDSLRAQGFNEQQALDLCK